MWKGPCVYGWQTVLQLSGDVVREKAMWLHSYYTESISDEGKFHTTIKNNLKILTSRQACASNKGTRRISIWRQWCCHETPEYFKEEYWPHKSFNLEKVGQKFKQKVETLMASYKEGNEIMEKKPKQPIIAFLHKIFCLYLCHPLSLHQCDKFPPHHWHHSNKDQHKYCLFS